MKFLLFFLLLLISCAPKSVKKIDIANIDNSSTNRDSVIFVKQPEIFSALSYFTSSYLYELKGNPTIAYSGYLYAHDYDSNSTELMEALVRTAPSDSLKAYWATEILSVDSTNRPTLSYLADNAFINNDKPTAIKYYEKLIEQDPTIKEEYNYIYYRLGSLYSEAGNIGKSVEKFQVLIEQGERLSFVRKNLVLMLSQRNDTTLIDSLYNVWSMYDNIDKYSILSEYGLFLESHGKERKANSMYNSALSFAQTSNDTLEMYKSISSNSFQLKLNDKMVSTTKKILEKDSTYLQGINRLALYYYDVDSIDLSKKYLTQSLSIDSTQILSIYFLGIIETKMRNYDKARSLFEASININKEYTPSYLNLGYIEIITNNLDRADTLLSFVLKKDSTTYNSHYFYGLTKLRQKNYPAAVHHIGRALDLSGRDDAFDIKFDFASALERNNQIDSSITVFKEIVKQNENFDPALNYLGYLLIDKEIDIEQGFTYITRALELDSLNGAYIDSKAWYYYKKGNYKESLKYLLQAYKIVGEDLEIIEHLADVYTKLNEKEKASKFYKKILEIRGKK